MTKELTSFVIVFGLIGCRTITKTDSEPKMNLATKNKMDSIQPVWQRYQRIGFTNVSEDKIMVAKLNNPPNSKKRFPITVVDLEPFGTDFVTGIICWLKKLKFQELKLYGVLFEVPFIENCKKI
jgi:hypothetical protein